MFRCPITVVVSTAFLISCDAPTGPARKPAIEGLQNPQEIVIAPPDSNFIELRREVAQGSRRSDGACTFVRTVHVKKGESGAERAVLLDPSSCRYEFAIGRVIKPNREKSQSGMAKASGTARLLLNGLRILNSRSSGDMLAAAQIGGGNLFVDQYSKDPAWLTTTQFATHWSWSTDNSCITNLSGYWETSWLSDTGWRQFGAAQSGQWGCSSGSGDGDAYFNNNTFCFNNPTFADYAVGVWFYAQGNSAFSHSGTNSGGCSWMLRYYMEYSS